MSSITSWKYTVQAVPSKKKKKLQEQKRKGKRGGKEEKKKKMDGKSLCGRGRNRCGRKEETKMGRMRCGKKRRKEGIENEGEGE